MIHPSQICRAPSLIIKRKHSYSTRPPRSRSSSTSSPKPPQRWSLVVMDKTEYIIKCEALLQDNSVYQHLSKCTSPTIHKELIRILQDYKNNNFISEIEYTQQIPQGSNSPTARFYGLLKSIRKTCLCAQQFQLVAQQHTTLPNLGWNSSKLLRQDFILC